MSLTFRSFALLNWHFFCTVASLKVSAVIVYDVATEILDTGIFPQHTIADLNSEITFIVLFSQEKPIRWKEINTHTHTPSHTLTVWNRRVMITSWFAGSSSLLWWFCFRRVSLEKKFLIRKMFVSTMQYFFNSKIVPFIL